MSSKIKGFKVTNSERSRTCGIACKSLDDLLTKSCIKFQIKEEVAQLYLQDGTLVDDKDYFATLPAQTCFILIKKGQQLLTGADIIYNALCAVNVDTLKAGISTSEFFHDDIVKEKIVALSNLIARPVSDNIQILDRSNLSLREDDPAWFEGLDTGARNKESFMRRRCSDRMRGYLYKTEKDFRLHPDYQQMQQTAENTMSSLKRLLSCNMNMGHYFDRSHDESLCDKYGIFTCDGIWFRDKCKSIDNHTINPYSSREQRIIFSTWNLDHRIEKSREVFPSLVKACLTQSLNPESYEVNNDYFFSLLFTTSNLRLVHIVCHDKGAHTSAKCDPSLILIDKTKLQSKGIKRKFSMIADDLKATGVAKA